MKKKPENQTWENPFFIASPEISKIKKSIEIDSIFKSKASTGTDFKIRFIGLIR